MEVQSSTQDISTKESDYTDIPLIVMS